VNSDRNTQLALNSDILGWAGLVACMRELENAYNIFVGKLKFWMQM
jgi:hypothetical protein